MKKVIIPKPGEMSVVESEIPVLNENEALLQIKYCGICGADVASYTGHQPFTTYPRVPGHEFSAMIAEIPANDLGFKVGDIVTANPYFNCGHCYSCKRGLVNCCMTNETMGVHRDGSFSQYIAMPISRLYKGKGLDAKQLALVEPFGISWHALSRCPVGKGDKALVIGAGPIGLFALISAKIRGAAVYVADLLDNRLQLAKEYGADGVINSKENDIVKASEELTNGNGFDVVIEACGLPQTFLSSIDCAAYGARLILIGNGKRDTTFNHSVLLKKELNLFPSRNSTPKDFNEIIDTIAAGKVDVMKMVSRTVFMENSKETFDSLVNNDGTLAKILVEVNP